MGRVVARTDVDGANDAEELGSLCEQAFRDVVSQVNGNLEFDKNMLTETVSVTFPASANTEQRISHKMNRIISDYIVCKKSVACDVYDGTTDADKNSIYLKCTVASATVKLILKGS